MPPLAQLGNAPSARGVKGFPGMIGLIREQLEPAVTAPKPLLRQKIQQGGPDALSPVIPVHHNVFHRADGAAFDGRNKLLHRRHADHRVIIPGGHCDQCPRRGEQTPQSLLLARSVEGKVGLNLG